MAGEEQVQRDLRLLREREGREQLTTSKETRAVYLYQLGTGATGTALLIFAPLLVATQLKYEASRNVDFIEWRKGYIEGALCNGTGLPNPRDTYEAYVKPDGYSDDCLWFPVDKVVDYLNVDYTAVMIFAHAISLLLTALLLLIVGPIPDYGSYRKPLLIVGTYIWIAGVAVTPAFSSTKSSPYLMLVLAVTTAVAIFCEKSVINGYMTLLIWNHPDLHKANASEPNSSSPDKQLEANTTKAVDSTISGRATAGIVTLEGVAVRITMVSGTCFVVSQLVGLAVQAAMVVAFEPPDDDPTATLGLRLAVFSSAVPAAVLNAFAIRNMRQRPGKEFPKGSVLVLGARHMLDTVRTMGTHLPVLLVFMVGRTLVWITTSTLLITGVLFLEREFSMQADELAPLLFLLFLVGGASNMSTVWLAKRYQGQVYRGVLVLSTFAVILPIYMAVGMRSRWEAYILFTVGAASMSPFPGLCRVLMTDLIPATYTSTVMSLDALIETLTAWMGPLVVALILDNASSLRWGVASAIIYALMGIPVLMRFDHAKGVVQRKAFETLLLEEVTHKRIEDAGELRSLVNVTVPENNSSLFASSPTKPSPNTIHINRSFDDVKSSAST